MTIEGTGQDVFNDGPNISKKTSHHPRLDNYRTLLGILGKNKVVLVCTIIVLFYATIDLLDWFWPQYLGVSAGNNLENALTAFQRLTGVTYNGHPYFVGVYVTSLPYGSGSIYELIPPTLTGPTGTPSWWWWFGGTNFGLPLLPVVLASLKWDLTYTALVVFVGATVGTLLGSVSGYFGGALDGLIMRLSDVFFSIPYLIIAIAVVYLFGTTFVIVAAALIIVWWPNYARLARGKARILRSSNFVEASVASGASKFRVVFSHIIPNVLTPIFVQITLDFGLIIQVVVTLNFIGSKQGLALPFLYENPFVPELGNILGWGDSLNYLYSSPVNWWPVLIPGIFLIVFTISVSLLGDSLRDIFDPRSRG